MDVASLVIGVISSLIGFIPCINMLVLVPAVVGLILGIVAYRSNSSQGLPTGTALAGIILNSLPLLVIAGYFLLLMQSGESSYIDNMIIK